MELPNYIAVALAKGWGQLRTYNIDQSFATGNTNVDVYPSDDGVHWVIYSYRYGEVDPEGPTSNVKIEYDLGGGIVKPYGGNVVPLIEVNDYIDKLTHATLDFDHPCLFVVNNNRKLRLKVTNDTGSAQTVDIQLLILEIKGDDDLENLVAWAQEYYEPLTEIECVLEPPVPGDEEGEVPMEDSEYCQVVN